MNDIKKAKVSRLIDRLLDLKERSGGIFNPPAWALDKSRYSNDGLTPDEQQEWAACVCQQIRSSIALTYQIQCIERWGRRGDEVVFVLRETVLQLTREIIENVLITRIEVPILEEKTEEKHLAVYEFYSRTPQVWFSEFLDELFIETAEKLRIGIKPQHPTFH